MINIGAMFSMADKYYFTKLYTDKFRRETLIPCVGTYYVEGRILNIIITPTVPMIACLA